MSVAPAESYSNNRPKSGSSSKSTHHFVSDRFLDASLYNGQSNSSPTGATFQRPDERQVSWIRPIADATSKIFGPDSDAAPHKSRSNSAGTAFASSGAMGVAPPPPKPASDKVSSLGAPTTPEAICTTKSSEEHFGEESLTKLSSGDRDETISVTSEESDGNMSIPHGELADETQGDTVRLDTIEDTKLPTSSAMPTQCQARLNEWFAVHGRVLPPCATTTTWTALISRNAAGELCYYIHKSGERLVVSLYSLSDILPPKKSQTTQRVIIAQGPTQGPFLIRFASAKNWDMIGASYKIWHGVRGGDKDGFELKPSVFKRYKSTGTKSAKPSQDTKIVVLKKKSGFRGNQFYEADGTPKSRTPKSSKPKPRTSKSGTAATGGSATSKVSYNFRPPKRLKQGEENPESYSKLLAAFSSSAEPVSSHMQGQPALHNDLSQKKRVVDSNQITEHIQNNAVFLFFSKKSPQPRARLFSACNTIQKLFAHALAGDVFEEESTTAKVLSVRVAGQRKARAVVEDDEQDFDDVVEELKAASCWVTATNGELSGSCTVEVRARS